MFRNVVSSFSLTANSFIYLLSINNTTNYKKYHLLTKQLSISEFKNAIKLCAPLATNSWIIFIEVQNNKIKYGITSAEMSETSPSIYNQTVGELKIEDYKDITIAYIKNIGQ